MAEQGQSLLLEHMKQFQAGQERVERRLEEIIVRLGSLEISTAGIRRDLAHNDEGIAHMSVRIDRINERIERIERRLEIINAP